MELFMRDAEGYRIAADESFLNERVIADLYRVEESTVQMFRIPSLNVVKISFPRPISQGSLRDRDMHAGQHHVPLALMPIAKHQLFITGTTSVYTVILNREGVQRP
jgi:hypothetical protein